MKKKQAHRAGRAAHYPKFVEWSEEDCCFVGRCPDLFDGGVHGDSEAQVYRELCEAAEEWVRLIEDSGRALPASSQSKRFSGKFVVRVDPAVHQRLALKAKAVGESLNAFVAKALRRA